MRNINKIMVAGNIVADAKYDKVCTFSVAVNSQARDDDGEWTDYPNFVDCVIFGKFGETMAEYITKGTKVFIEGAIHQSRWEDKDGNNRSKLEVWVDNIELAPRKEDTKAKKRSYR